MAADLVSLPPCRGFIGCIVVIDHFSKWVCAVPIRGKKSSTIVQLFKTQIFPHLPKVPTRLMTDNGPEFSSHEFATFLHEFGVSQQFTTPYHPSSNEVVERVNQTLLGLLGNLTKEGSNWVDQLPKALIVYNNTSHSELQMSPTKFILSR